MPLIFTLLLKYKDTVRNFSCWNYFSANVHRAGACSLCCNRYGGERCRKEIQIPFRTKKYGNVGFRRRRQVDTGSGASTARQVFGHLPRVRPAFVYHVRVAFLDRDFVLQVKRGHNDFRQLRSRPVLVFGTRDLGWTANCGLRFSLVYVDHGCVRSRIR